MSENGKRVLKPFIPRELREADLTHQEYRVWTYLWSRKNKEGLAWPSIRTLFKQCRMSSKSIYPALKGLEDKGWLEYVKRGPAGKNDPNLYRPIYKPAADNGMYSGGSTRGGDKMSPNVLPSERPRTPNGNECTSKLHTTYSERNTPTRAHVSKKVLQEVKPERSVGQAQPADSLSKTISFRSLLKDKAFGEAWRQYTYKHGIINNEDERWPKRAAIILDAYNSGRMTLEDITGALEDSITNQMAIVERCQQHRINGTMEQIANEPTREEAREFLEGMDPKEERYRQARQIEKERGVDGLKRFHPREWLEICEAYKAEEVTPEPEQEPTEQAEKPAEEPVKEEKTDNPVEEAKPAGKGPKEPPRPKRR